MRGKRKSPMRFAKISFSSYLLLGCAVILLAGCQGGVGRKTAIDPTGNVPSEKTEAQLVAEINEKFENPSAHYELARVYHQSRQWTKAEYHYNVALGFDPAFRAAQAGLVKAFVDQSQAAKAEQHANTYLRQAASNSERETLRLGWEFEKLELDDYALRCFQRALQIAPNSFETHRQIGFFYLGNGDSENAKKYLSRSFELNPRQADVAGALGRLGVVVQTPGSPGVTGENQE